MSGNGNGNGSLPGSSPLILMAVVTALAIGIAGCHSSHGGGGAGKVDGGPDSRSCGDGGARKTNGAPCGCNADCASDFCVDGVCCNSVCTESCKSCNTPSAPGICSFVAAGVAPSLASVCPQDAASSCGLDGTCDGKGGCRSYELGTVCQEGTCNGAAIGGIHVCDGAGNCTSGPSIICTPFNCDGKTNACAGTCASDSDCAPNTKCVAGSCGLKPSGAACTTEGQCASGHCADGVCCNSSCTGPCVSCNQNGRIGTCEPTALNAPDPHKVCTQTAPSTCGQTGSCDGIGGCAKYAAETVCLPASCSGNRENTAGTCDGLGSCRPQGVQECGTYECTGGACINHCVTDGDCVSGHSCVNGSCGPKSNGQPCSAGTECASSFCADAVCCNSACTGSCRSCALSTSLGSCASSPAAAADPHGVCIDNHASSCGTDGTCDGSGGCHKYPTGTECASESCGAGIYTPTSTCDATGKCHVPDAFACAPFVCNGARCYSNCNDNSSCSSGNVCTAGSCGLKLIGAFCSNNVECQSAFCAEGVCCATACAGACRSCAITGTMGQCTAVASGPDPAGSCMDKGAQSCGTDGKCQAGACEKYQQGTSCQNATCPTSGTTFTPGGTCDGAGTCGIPASSSCFPFACGTNACKATCATNSDCAMPASCIAGSCGLKPNGAVCSSGTECKSTICAQGVCCGTACAGTCMSCALTGAAGTCSPVAANGADPAGTCTAEGAASCRTTGFCDGNGACQLYAAGTQCAGAACPSGAVTATSARTCDGAGICKMASTQSCVPFSCNAATGTACVAVCASNADCSPGNVCNAGACGLKRLGQLCAAGAECGSGNCVDGVCCSTASCATCQVCSLGGTGSCQAVPAGNMEPHGNCAATNPPCGNDGSCDGSGNCRNGTLGTSCGVASCTGSTTAKPIGACDGVGNCAQPTMSCAAYVCSSASNACLTMCATPSDCISGYTCQSGSCINLKALGTSCGSGAECLSTFCTDGVCCSSGPSCGSCKSCAVSGKTGNCTAVAAGADPAGMCMDQGATSCGTTGLCDGAGNCANYAAQTPCGPAACQTGSSVLKGAAACDASGHCVPASTIDCSPYACVSGACNASCTQPSDCASGNSCVVPDGGGAGTCVAM